MTRCEPAHTNAEERQPGLMAWAYFYLPVVWALSALLRSVISEFYEEWQRQGRDLAPEPNRSLITQNRQQRRAKAACMRRVKRCGRKGRVFKPQNYIPKAYAYFEYAKRVPAAITPSQFAHYCARVSGLGWARVLGLCSTHEIRTHNIRAHDNRCVSGREAGCISGACADRVFAAGSLSYAALDPAPP